MSYIYRYIAKSITYIIDGFIRGSDDNVEPDFVVDFPFELPMMHAVVYSLTISDLAGDIKNVFPGKNCLARQGLTGRQTFPATHSRGYCLRCFHLSYPYHGDHGP
jgi:hypothetical protein